MISSSYYEPKCEKIWKARRCLKRAEKAMDDARYWLERVIVNEYAHEAVFLKAKAHLQALEESDEQD